MPIRVLVVDDSFFSRKRLIDMLSSDPQIAVIDTAQDGFEAIKKVIELQPDVVTLDIEMARMDGLTALNHIMKECPTPVIMVSTLTEEGSAATAQALLEGALDFIHKPTDLTSISKIQDELIAKVKVAAKARLKKKTAKGESGDIRQEQASKIATTSDKIVMIGTSTGGPRALIEVLPRLPKNFPWPIAVVQHMPPGPFIKSIAQRLNTESNIRVAEAQDGDHLVPGTALMAPGGYHMLIEKGGIVRLSHGPTVNSVRPSVDVLMNSGTAVYGHNCIGVILTGMGRDGADGMAQIKRRGGHTIAEHESTCVVYGMPKVVIDEGNADVIAPLERIPQELMNMIEGKSSYAKLCG
ncbi:MAG: chemotaxis response regulator protein-glutamate methylesterase [Firmicutes bacterium]|nr:chemotaxis response regulator protein-glutamate methylesterase [Bacillota bacterium]